MKLVVVVLAAGQSRRFGNRDKLRAPVAGLPLAAHAVRALRGLPRHGAVVVLRDRGLAGLFPGYRKVILARGRSAQGISLGAGLGAARRMGASHALMVLADMPCLTRADLVLIATGAGTHPAMARGRVPMPPALIPRALFSRLIRLKGDRGAGQILRSRPDLVLRDLPAARLVDVDRPRDLPRRTRKP